MYRLSIGILVKPKLVVNSFSIEQIVPYFQPIYDLRNQKVVRYECLARLISQDDNIYLPSEFLYIVDKEQTNAELSQRILQLSSAYCLSKNMPWSINMFQSDLRNEGLVNWIKDLCEKTTPDLIGIEIAYSSIKSHPHLVTQLIDRIPHLHVTLDNIDKFDNGLESLVKEGVKAIKLKSELIKYFLENEGGVKALMAMQLLCKQNNCQLIAEHIEDDTTLDTVQGLDILYGQGYYLSQPQGRMSSLKHV